VLIEDYGLIGNLESAALVGRNGAIDWLCLPRFDSASCFSALRVVDFMPRRGDGPPRLMPRCASTATIPIGARSPSTTGPRSSTPAC
jgi:GH15 family glucan-1,4-alpha-glucosidase